MSNTLQVLGVIAIVWLGLGALVALAFGAVVAHRDRVDRWLAGDMPDSPATVFDLTDVESVNASHRAIAREPYDQELDSDWLEEDDRDKLIRNLQQLVSARRQAMFDERRTTSTLYPDPQRVSNVIPLEPVTKSSPGR